MTVPLSPIIATHLPGMRSLASVICQTGRAKNEAYFLTVVVTIFCVINELVIQAPKTLTFLQQQQLFIMKESSAQIIMQSCLSHENLNKFQTLFLALDIFKSQVL